jgi:DNA ligase-1
MRQFAQTAEAIAATSKKSEKVRITADYLRSLPPEDAARAALFLSGRAFPAWEETTLQVGGALIWRAVVEVSGAGEPQIAAAYRRHGDLGAATSDIFEEQSCAGASPAITLAELEQTFRTIAETRGPAAKLELVSALLRRAKPAEAKYLVKIMSGEMRIGLRESLVEEAIAAAYSEPPTAVQRANMLLGSLGDTVRLASEHRLDSARMRLFHPIGFMLASPAETATEAFEYIHNAVIEDKYDGIRAQAHVGNIGGERVTKLFSRTLDEITESFPELPPALAGFQDDVIFDGEVVAWRSVPEKTDAHLQGRALPFPQLQQRLGRKRVTREVMHRVPVAYVVFDVLYAAGELVIDRPLQERQTILDRVFAEAREVKPVAVPTPQGRLALELAAVEEDSNHPTAPVLRAPAVRAASVAELEQVFEAALERGNEGLMVKDAASPYTPGRRGKWWLKLKRELATLDVVVTAVELGHGKRAGVLSDYTFAVRDPKRRAAKDTPATPQGEALLNVGKAYSGLTDAEIAEMTGWFRGHTIHDDGFRRIVEPKIVIEVAFNAVMRSDRHESGFALRFPRILRLRPDKPVSEADTLERVREIYARQKGMERP